MPTAVGRHSYCIVTSGSIRSESVFRETPKNTSRKFVTSYLMACSLLIILKTFDPYLVTRYELNVLRLVLPFGPFRILLDGGLVSRC